MNMTRSSAPRLAIVGWVTLLVIAASFSWVDNSQSQQPRLAAAPISVHVSSGTEVESRATLLRFHQAPLRPPSEAALTSLIRRNLTIRARPGAGKVIGVMPATSRYLRVPTVAWIQARSPNGRFGKVSVPYSGMRAVGWISLAGLKLGHSQISVRADLSKHRVTVSRSGRVIMRFPAATGGPSSPTPPGRYFVTDRVPEDPSGPLGAFAFGISGIQTQLPPGWRGGNLLAIHGTNNPGTIGMSVSAGCLRVSARVLEELKPLLQLGTPVIIAP
jgi:hypothetical protein